VDLLLAQHPFTTTAAAAATAATTAEHDRSSSGDVGGRERGSHRQSGSAQPPPSPPRSSQQSQQRGLSPPRSGSDTRGRKKKFKALPMGMGAGRSSKPATSDGSVESIEETGVGGGGEGGSSSRNGVVGGSVSSGASQMSGGEGHDGAMSCEVLQGLRLEEEALRRCVVHSGDAGNSGCKWWTPGVESAAQAEGRVRELVEQQLRLSPDQDVCLVCHSHLIQSVFRLYGDHYSSTSSRSGGESSSSSASASSARSGEAMRELRERKLENCGVVALRMDFGPLFPGVDGQKEVAVGSSGRFKSDRVGASSLPWEARSSSILGGAGSAVLYDVDDDEDEEENDDEAEKAGPKYITDAVYLFGSNACKLTK